MKPLQSLLQLLDGKKTYGTALAMVVFAGLGYYLKFLTYQDAANYLFAAFTLIGGRSVLQKLIDAVVNYTPVIVHQHIIQDNSQAIPIVTPIETIVPKTEIVLQPAEVVTQQVI